MHYAVLRLELRVRDSRSLKEKRAVLLHLKERLRHRFHLSVQEVDYQDLHQRAALGVALVANSAAAGRDALLAVRREVESDPRVVVIDAKSRFGRIARDDASDWTRLATDSADPGRSADELEVDPDAEDSPDDDEEDWTLPGFETIERPGDLEDPK